MQDCNKKGHVLERHKDRLSCEVSTTLNLGGDPWPIYLEPSGREGMKGLRVDLNPGDMLIYRGMDLEHWREPFQGMNAFKFFYTTMMSITLMQSLRWQTTFRSTCLFKRNGK